MADDTNPVTTPSGQPPAQAPDGTLLNQAAIPPTQTDSSSTPPATTTPEPKTEPSTPDPTKTALNNEGKPPEGAPEKYTDFKLPEGLKLQPEVMTEASALFKGMDLSQTDAQSLIDFHAKQIASISDAPINAVTAIKQDWEGKLKATYGAKLEPGGEVITRISRVIDSLPTQIGADFREAMDLTLAGSNPGFVAAFDILCQRLSEGKSVKGNGPSPGGQKSPDAAPKSVAQAMYPHLKSANDPQS